MPTSPLLQDVYIPKLNPLPKAPTIQLPNPGHHASELRLPMTSSSIDEGNLSPIAVGLALAYGLSQSWMGKAVAIPVVQCWDYEGVVGIEEKSAEVGCCAERGWEIDHCFAQWTVSRETVFGDGLWWSLLILCGRMVGWR